MTILDSTLRIKPCPFCGGNVGYSTKESTNIYRRFWSEGTNEYAVVQQMEVKVHCCGCGATTHGRGDDVIEAAD